MSADNVAEFTGVTLLDTPPDRILNVALQAGLIEVVVVGFDNSGDFYFKASKSDGGAALWLLALAQKKLLEVGDVD
jgi:hypothetical protein